MAWAASELNTVAVFVDVRGRSILGEMQRHLSLHRADGNVMRVKSRLVRKALSQLLVRRRVGFEGEDFIARLQQPHRDVSDMRADIQRLA